MIRPMTKVDIPEVAVLERAYFSVPWTEAGLQESLESGNYIFLVAEEEGRIIGYGGLLKALDEGDITNIVVEESMRGRGIGSRIVRMLLEEGERRGLQAFTLEVRVGNQAAIRVYEKLGFAAEGIRRGFYEKPAEDALIMWKRKPEK